ncbi:MULTISPECIES: hypothetical protein [unclassified Rhodococcus (in: high G+C Gram-positive bacteria)]|uniref:hypothetical protein n=1 Tax=unclassified Rhodococcus (in: high G+C Gram-positive bacteria) TaxID=192944 RepID=UPI00117B1968|nr:MULTISPECIES: hypothetical protein [unclassified Rhodococcus (in: high G+C Gram-positive bacteria)]
MAVGAIVALRLLLREDTRLVRPVIGVFCLVLCLNQLIRLNLVGFVTLLAPIMVGAAVAISAKRPLAILTSASAVLSVSMVVEYAMKQHVFGQLFGQVNYVAFSQDIFRARGIVGQPVPASMVAVGLAAGALVLTSGARRYSVATRLVIVVAAAASVYTSGTRSAVICSAALALILLGGHYIRTRSGVAKIGVGASWGFPLIGALVLLVGSFTWSAISGQRVFSFASLAGSASLDNRNYAGLVFDEWNENCQGVCQLFGYGARNLLETLSSGLGFRGFTTVDNLYLSILWDFGVVLVIALGILLVVAIRVAVKSGSQLNRAGAIIVLSVLMSGVFYDALYIRPVLLLFGFGVGLMGKVCTENKEAKCVENP